jgi:hypothetical protein
MYRLYAGWQKKKSHPSSQKKLWRFLWPGECSSTSAMEPACGRAQRALWEWLLHPGWCRWHSILISIKFPNTVSELLYEALITVQQCCDRTQLSINPQKTDRTSYQEERLKEPKVTSPFWTHTAAEYRGQITWTNGQGIATERATEKCDS